MFYFLLVLTGLSLIALIIGFIGMLRRSGQKQYLSGDQVGADIFAGQMDDDDQDIQVGEFTAFRGKAAQVSVETSYSFAEIKDQLVTGGWRQLLPVLLAAGGLIGLLLFGSLALFLGLEDKLIGGLMVLLVLYTLIRILWNFYRA